MPDRVRVLFATCGEARTGAGHLVRDLALAAHMSSTAGTTFALPAATAGAESIEAAGFEVFVGDLAAAIETMLPSVLVYDRPAAWGVMEDMPTASIPPVIGLDYFAYDDARIAAFVNVKSHGLSGVQPHNIYEGMQYAIVRSEILTSKAAASPIVTPARQVLVTFGGTDPADNVHRVLALLAADPPSPTVDVVLGRSYAGSPPISEGVDLLAVHRDVSDMGSRMAAADLVFCGAGVTLAEALTLSRPVCVMPQNAHELGLAKEVHRMGACGLLDPEHPDEWLPIVRDVRTDSRLRQNLSARAAALCDGRGLERVAEIIMRYGRAAQ